MRRIAIPLLLAAVVAAAAPAGTASALPTCTTTSVATGDWSAAGTWSAGVPDAADHVCVGAVHDVTLSGPATVQTLQLRGDLSIASGTLALTGADESLLTGELDGAGTLELAGPMTWSGGYMLGSGVTRVLAGAVLTQQTNSVNLWDTRTLEVAGTFRQATAGRGVSRSGTPLISVTATGLLQNASAGSTFVDPIVHSAGRVEAPAAGALLELNTGGGSGSSSGRFGSAGAQGTVRFDGSAPHRLADGAQFSGGVEIGGAITIPSGATVRATGANRQSSSGDVQGAGTLEIAGTFDWTGGYMTGSGVTKVLTGAVLTQQTNSVNLWESRTLEVAGTLRQATAGRGISRSGTPLISVAATGLIENASTGGTFIDPIVHSAGRVEAPAAGALLELNTGGGTGSSSGTFGSSGSQGTVRFDGSAAHRLADGARFLGGVEIGGAVTIPADATVRASGANRESSSGDVQGAGTLEIGGTFDWTGGYMTGSGLTKVLTGAVLTQQTNTVNLWETRVLENAGTIVLATADRGISRSGTPAIRNLAGATIRKTAGGTSVIDPPVENDGTIVAEAAGSTLTIRGGTTQAVSSGSFGGGAGTVRMDSQSSGRFTLAAGASLPGPVAVASGSLTVADGATVTASGPLSLTGGAVDGGGTLAVTGPMTWSGGSMGGAGVTSVGPGATLTVPGQGGLQLGGTRVLRVAGVADLAEDNSIFPGTGASPLLDVLPTGVLRKSGGDSWSFVSVPVRNQGAVRSTAGELQLSKGAPQPHSGSFDSTSAAARVALTGTGHVLTGAATLGDSTRIAGDVAVREGDVLEIAGSPVQTDGELSGDVEVTGTLRWSGGSHDAPGATTVAAGGAIVLDPEAGDTCAATSLGEARRLAIAEQGALRLLDGSRLSAFGDRRPEIHNDGRIELDSAGGGCGGFTGIAGDALVRNTGVIEKLGGGGDSYVGSSLDNDGEVLASAGGDLRLEANAATGHSGSFRGDGGTVAFDSGTFVLDPGAQVQGDAALTGGELRLPEGMTLEVAAGDVLRQEDGTLAGAGDVRVLGTLRWSGGSQEGPGTTEIAQGASAVLAPAGEGDTAFLSLERDRSLVNRGQVTVGAATLGIYDGTSILNAGMLEVQGGSDLSGFGFGDGFSSLLHNTGTVRKAGTGTAQVDVPVDNDGTVAVDQGTLDTGTLLNWSGNDFFGESGLTGGTWTVKGTLVVPGLIKANGARLELDGTAAQVVTPGTLGTFRDAVATLGRNAGNGELVLRGGRSLTVPGAFVNQGTLELGPGSTLNAKGFRQTAGAVLRPLVTAAGAGRIASSEAAQLGGRLATPEVATEPGDSTVLTAPAVSGAFSAVTGGYEAIVSATDVRLRQPGTVGRVAPRATDHEPDAVLQAAPDAPAPAVPAVRRIAGDALRPAGPWDRRGGYLVARSRSATLTVRAVRGRGLAIVARTGPRAGRVRVTWAGRSRALSLRSARLRRRTVRVFAPGRERAGTVRVRSLSARPVAVRALLVRG